MNKTIEFTRKEINELSVWDMNRIVMCTNDGQGDTNVWPLGEFRIQCEDDSTEIKGISNSEFIDTLWEDTNANMTTFIWLEDCEFKVIEFLK